MLRGSVSLALLCALGCGPRRLDVVIAIDSGTCSLALPASSSLLYEVETNGSFVDGGSGSFCGACLPVDRPIAGASDVLALLRTSAPSCAGVHPSTTFGVRLIGWPMPACPVSTSAPAFCIEGPTVLVPDGASDTTIHLALTCHAQCSAGCVPTSCDAEGKNCDPISDGCGAVLDCGTCKPPLRCSGSGMPNVCGR
jgi:hypothetical protein